MSGALVLVATPIGNLGDLSARAVEELGRADVVACEDTRRTGRLLAHAGIEGTSLVRLDQHEEPARAAALVERIAGGERVVLVTDAGMPAISDPGELVVRAAVAAGVEVTVVPGPSAGVAALAVSGLPTGRMAFEGFLPRKGAARAERLAELAGERRTIVLYEAPHRLARTLTDLVAALGPDRPVVLARELTKLHEELWRGTLAEAADRVAEVAPRGEYVLVVAGAPNEPPATDDRIVDALDRQRTAGASTRDAVAAVAAELRVSRRRVYELALAGGST